MDPKLVDLIQQIAEKLGLAVAHLWPEMVLRFWIQSLINVIVEVVVMVGGALAIAWILRRLVRYHRSQRTAFEAHKGSGYYSSSLDYDTFGWDLVAGAAIVVFVFGIIVALVSIGTDLSNVFVPEAGLTMKLLGK